MSDEVEITGAGKCQLTPLGWWAANAWTSSWGGWWGNRSIYYLNITRFVDLYIPDTSNPLTKNRLSWWWQIDNTPHVELTGKGQLAFSPAYGYGQLHSDTEAQISGAGALAAAGAGILEVDTIAEVIATGALIFWGNVSNDVAYSFSYGWWNPYGWWPDQIGWWWTDYGDYQQQSRYV